MWQVDAYTMKLVEKKNADAKDALMSMERKVKSLERDNSRLRAAFLSAKNELARLKHMKPEIHQRGSPTVDRSVQECSATISYMAAPKHVHGEQELRIRLVSAQARRRVHRISAGHQHGH